MIRIDEKYGTKVEEVSIVQSLFKMLKPDWVSFHFLIGISLIFVFKCTVFINIFSAMVPL